MSYLILFFRNYRRLKELAYYNKFIVYSLTPLLHLINLDNFSFLPLKINYFENSIINSNNLNAKIILIRVKESYSSFLGFETVNKDPINITNFAL